MKLWWLKNKGTQVILKQIDVEEYRSTKYGSTYDSDEYCLNIDEDEIDTMTAWGVFSFTRDKAITIFCDWANAEILEHRKKLMYLEENLKELDKL